MATTVIGLMSGTSLDGVDLIAVNFSGINYTVIAAETVKYPLHLIEKLQKCMLLDAQALCALDAELGLYYGKIIANFCKKHQVKPAYVSSHGHTVFHDPSQNYTLQIGRGSHIAAITKITTVCDFRSTDIALKGQGAPLVPIGDEHLFKKYTYCLNLGGIANISYTKNKKRIAFDICVCNMALNYLADKLGHSFDKNGMLARKGNFNAALYKKLNKLAYYKQTSPKSLGKEWFLSKFLPLLEASTISIYDKLFTVSMHIAYQISRILVNTKKTDTILVTGGGALNTFLIELLQEFTIAKVVLPKKEIINFKEALIFAYLGYLRMNKKMNTLSSVTGSKHNSIGGAVYLG